MPTLGEELRQKREQRGVTLAEISEATRIGTRFLKAIETDSFSILPGGIFTRSFIRAYAKYVGMNEDEAIALYLQQVNPPASEQTATAEEQLPAATKRSTPTLVAAPPPARSEPSPRRFEPVAYRQAASRISWPTIVIGGGIVVFVVLIVLAVVKQLNKGGQEGESQATSVPQKNAPAQAPPQNAAPRPSPSTETQQPPAQSPSGTTLVVKLEAATGDSWIRYQVDDAKPSSFTLKKGETRDVPPAQGQVALSLGNRLVLKIRINDREAIIPPDTPKFNSKVVITRENLQTYFQ